VVRQNSFACPQITRITRIQNKKIREPTFQHSGSIGGSLCFEVNEIPLENDSARTQAGILKSEYSGNFAAIIKKYLLSFLAVILFEAGCSTEAAKQDAAGLATVSALVVALPLLPFALPYSAIEQAKDRKYLIFYRPVGITRRHLTLKCIG
jgi:hypothetical protein